MIREHVSFRAQSTRPDGRREAQPGHADETERVRRYAVDLGFHAVGIARADVALDRDIERYDAFVAAGMHGEMEFLARHRDARARLDGHEILPGAKSVVCLARRYQRAPTAERDVSTLAGSIARYARGRDYHRFLRRRLRRLASMLRSLGTAERPVRARPLCDEEPILERAWAARAGLGFVGKNGMLIVPGVGSMVLLGEVVTTLELAPDSPLSERCGGCTRCIDACPTGALNRPFALDARLCLAYLTIEHRSAIPQHLRPAIDGHLFGCDDCQTVCPFNAGQGARADSSPEPWGDPFAPLERWSRLRLENLLSMDEPEWRAVSEGSPLKRAGRIGLARNAAIVLGNRGDEASLPALHTAARDHDHPTVREAAEWAIRVLRLKVAPGASSS